MKHVTRPTSFLSLAVLLASAGAFAVPIPTGTDDLTLNIHTHLQLRLDETWGGPPPNATSGAAPSGHLNTDIFLRRASFSTRGTAFKVFWYYLKLETGSFGKRGNYTGSTQIQDVVLGYMPFEDFYIEGGFLKSPLSRPAVDSSERANSLEGVSDILFYPNARAQRQNGIQVRGLLLDKRLLVRGGIYEGARAGNGGTNFTQPYVNPNGWPLLGGMVRVNLVGYETAYTYAGIHDDGKSYVSAGVGGQYQSHSGSTVQADGTLSDFVALAADAYVDLALSGDQEVVLILDGYHFDYGSGGKQTGFGAHSEAGYRLGPIEPYVVSYWFNSDVRTNSYLRLGGGLNWFVKHHEVKMTLEYEQTIAGGTLPNSPAGPMTPWLHQLLLQGQLSF